MNLLSKLDPRKLARFSGKEWLTEYATDDDEEDECEPAVSYSFLDASTEHTDDADVGRTNRRVDRDPRVIDMMMATDGDQEERTEARHFLGASPDDDSN